MDTIQNGRELLRFASPRQEHHRDTLVRIAKVNKTVHVDCRPCHSEELNSQCSLFALPAIDQNRWTHIRLQTSALNEDFSARQPQPSAIPKITLSPGVSKFWREPLRRPIPESETTLEIAFIAVIQGSAGSAVKKVVVSSEYPNIATAIFNEAINGYSVVFTGACLKSELEKARDYGPASLAVIWRKVAALDQMFETRTRASSRDGNERLVVGVLC